jgi:hypothetical protein
VVTHRPSSQATRSHGAGGRAVVVAVAGARAGGRHERRIVVGVFAVAVAVARADQAARGREEDEQSGEDPRAQHGRGLSRHPGAGGKAAKLALLLLRAGDGAAAGLLTPWAPAVLLYQEIWAVLAVLVIDRALLALGTWLNRPVLADRLGWALYAAAALYVAINVPIARQFATPLTYAFIEAAGGALRDSITAYATASNVLALVGLLLAGRAGVPRLLAGRRRRG